MRKCSQCGEMYDGAEMFCPVDGAKLVRFGSEEDTLDIIDTDEDAYTGKVIQGRYKVLNKIGEGGMGVVYVAEHVEIEKKVALKVLRDDFSKRPEVVERFRQEARSASKIGHPHIVDVIDFGQLDDGGVFFAMEFLSGCGLNEICRGEPVPLIRAVTIIEQIARALKAAHEKGIVHRDLKPENVFLVQRDERQDFVKILDFGIAKISDRDNEGKRLTKTGMIFGTPEYMSPEQAAGKELDHRVDVYALGCIMFELFTGQVPYDGDSFMAILTKHMFETIPSIEETNPQTDVPESVRAVVYKAMAKETQDRYNDMDDLRVDLERALVDANYIVEHPNRETTIRFETNEGKRIKKPTNEQIATTMDWNAASGIRDRGAKKSAASVIILIVAVVIIVGGLAGGYFGGFFVSPDVKVGGRSNPRTSVAADRVIGSPVQTDSGAPEKQVEESPAVEVMTTVSIKTTPQGAVISISGMGQVCSSAPCELELETGTPVEITATSGKKKKTLTFTPSEQNKELTLNLKAKAGGKWTPKAGGEKPAGKKAGSEKKTSGGLKIPDVFKDN